MSFCTVADSGMGRGVDGMWMKQKVKEEGGVHRAARGNERANLTRSPRNPRTPDRVADNFLNHLAAPRPQTRIIPIFRKWNEMTASSCGSASAKYSAHVIPFPDRI